MLISPSYISLSFSKLVFKYLESKNRHRGNRKKKVGDLLITLLKDKEI